jgi:SAM-dependent methyltransferase
VQLDRPGLDIGCGNDPLTPVFRKWDAAYGDGDATVLSGVPDGAFWTVYASHVLEHVHDPESAVLEWWRVLHSGGCLIICVPHMALYEGKTDLPSRWNDDHKTFWLPSGGRYPPHVRSLSGALSKLGGEMTITVLDEGHHYPDKLQHPGGEYSIEGIVRKP